MLKRLFTEHPSSVGETYVEHAGHAFSFGTSMIGAGLACLVHGLVPCLFKSTGSKQIAKLHERMVVSRTRRPTNAAGSARAHG